MRCHVGGGSSPSASAGMGGSEPAFTPIRIEMPRSCAARTTSRTLPASRMLPGLSRSPWKPPLIDSRASR